MAITTQTCTSKMTSVNSARLPAIYNKIDFDFIKQYYCEYAHFAVFDYGCGRYTEHIQKFMKDKGWEWIGYDPYWGGQSSAICDNLPMFECLKYDYEYSETPGIVVCLTSNVLNVLDSTQEIENIKRVCRVSRYGIYFHKIYEGDRSGVGRVTKDDCYQRNLPTRNYVNANIMETVDGNLVLPITCTIFLKPGK